MMRASILATVLFAVTVAPAARADDDTRRADRLAEAAVAMLPLGTIFEQIARTDPSWPAGARADAVDATQLACLRSELSVDGYRRLKRVEAREYVARHAARVEDDIRGIEDAAPIFSRLVVAGANEGSAAQSSQELVAAAPPEQVAAFMRFMSEPAMAPAREFVGIGDAFSTSRSQSDNERAGEEKGAALAIGTIKKATITCKVPPGAFL